MLVGVTASFSGAAGMYAFEKDTGAFEDYRDALWWTRMIVTALIATYIIGRDAENVRTEIEGSEQIETLQKRSVN